MALKFLESTVFADKLDGDHRSPAFTFALPSWSSYFGSDGDGYENMSPDGAVYGLLLPELSFWIQLGVLVLMEAVFGLVMSSIIYDRILLPRRHSYSSSSSSSSSSPPSMAHSAAALSSRLIGYGLLIPTCLLFPYYVIAALRLRNYILKFASAAMIPNLTVFRVTEALHGFAPSGAARSRGNHAVYCMSCMEVQFEDCGGDDDGAESTQTKKAGVVKKTGVMPRPARATAGDALRSGGKFLAFMVLLGLYVSLFGPSGYRPFGEAESGGFGLFNPRRLGNNFVAAILFQLYLTTFCHGLAAATNAIVGVKVVEMMKNPLFESTSPSEFWGKRWNTLVHGALKRGVFKPVRTHYPKYVAALAAFIASGLFHEWVLSAVFFDPPPEVGGGDEGAGAHHRPVYGRNLAFFVWNAAIIAAEGSFVGRWRIFGWMKSHLPRPLVTLLVVSTALPVAHWFTGDYLESDYFLHGQIGFPMIVRV